MKAGPYFGSVEISPLFLPGPMGHVNKFKAFLSCYREIMSKYVRPFDVYFLLFIYD